MTHHERQITEIIEDMAIWPKAAATCWHSTDGLILRDLSLENDLGLDSLDRQELGQRVAERLDLDPMDMDDAGDCRTVGELFDLAAKKLTNRDEPTR